MKTINKNKIFLIFLAILILFFLLKEEIKKDRFLEVSFLDVGQGDAIYIEAFNQTDMLIDGGRNPQVITEKLSSVMDSFDTHIDVLIITHPDEDHSGGLISIIKEYSIGSIFISGNFSDNSNYNQILKIASTKNIPTYLARAGENIYLDRDKEVRFEIIYPTENTSFVEANRTSISGRLIYGESEFLLTGDAYMEDEDIMLKNYKSLESDVLKLGHHGSRTSSSLSFLKMVNPEVVIVSAGFNNSYGHPHKEVMDRVNTLGIKSFATFEEGTITFRSDGEKIYLQE